MIKQELDAWLDQVDYSEINTSSYLPSEFALTFMNFIKLVNGETGESHKTPPFHLKMLDKVTSPSKYVANLCFRGAAKTTVFGEYLFPFAAVFGALPGLPNLTGGIYVSDSMENGVKSLRKNMEFRYKSSEFLQEWLPDVSFTDNYIQFENKIGKVFGLKMFGAKTGLRGTKIFGKRPQLCVMDDLVSDDDSKSKAAMEAIKDTVYKGVNHALDPVTRKVFFNGTPFNKEDILIEAVESGAWDVNVWPVCERFPVPKNEFVGAWPDRFTYDYVLEQYEMASNTGKLAAFNQELMLRITSDEDRLILDQDLRWYSRKDLLENRGNFNFYITTDFATSSKQTADYSVITVWALNGNGDFFWVDGVAQRMGMDKTIDHLFRLAQKYSPQSVGIEVTGQQGGFIPWIQKEMMDRNIWFNLASSEKSGAPGMRPATDKLSRLNLVVPWFKAGKMFFPKEMRESEIVQLFLGQIRLATHSGLKGKDDCLDTISMLGYMNVWRPSQAAPVTQNQNDMWDDDAPDNSGSRLSSYIA